MGKNTRQGKFTKDILFDLRFADKEPAMSVATAPGDLPVVKRKGKKVKSRGGGVAEIPSQKQGRDAKATPTAAEASDFEESNYQSNAKLLSESRNQESKPRKVETNLKHPLFETSIS